MGLQVKKEKQESITPKPAGRKNVPFATCPGIAFVRARMYEKHFLFWWGPSQPRGPPFPVHIFLPL